MGVQQQATDDREVEVWLQDAALLLGVRQPFKCAAYLVVLLGELAEQRFCAVCAQMQ